MSKNQKLKNQMVTSSVNNRGKVNNPINPRQEIWLFLLEVSFKNLEVFTLLMKEK